jgi:hypothetical protein
VTEKGYMGLEPRDTQKGDSIGVLLGSDVLFILRECRGRGVEIVGETYVHGIMMGEVIE